MVLGANELSHDLEKVAWINAVFLQGRGPGWQALASPWRVSPLKPGVVPEHLRQAMRRPIYLADPQTKNLLVYDHAWASKYSPARASEPGRSWSVCDSVDGPGCMDLLEQYHDMKNSGISLSPIGSERSQMISKGSGHGSSPLSQLVQTESAAQAAALKRQRAEQTAGRSRAMPHRTPALDLRTKTKGSGVSDAVLDAAMKGTHPKKALELAQITPGRTERELTQAAKSHHPTARKTEMADAKAGEPEDSAAEAAMARAAVARAAELSKEAYAKEGVPNTRDIQDLSGPPGAVKRH
jgi:hypothetical protein